MYMYVFIYICTVIYLNRGICLTLLHYIMHYYKANWVIPTMMKFMAKFSLILARQDVTLYIKLHILPRLLHLSHFVSQSPIP